MGHLNTESLQRLLSNPRQEEALYKHLAEGCDECEAFLAQSSHPLLDGATDAALLSLTGPVAAKDDPRAEATFRRIRRPPDRKWLYAIAALLLAFVAAWWLRPTQDSTWGLKGVPKLTVELQAVVKRPDGSLSRIEAGAPVPASGTLLIRYHASESGTANLVLVRGGRREALGSVELSSGTHDLTRDGALVGFSLEGERGPLGIRLETVESTAELTLEVQ
jgi:hypothetical protein